MKALLAIAALYLWHRLSWVPEAPTGYQRLIDDARARMRGENLDGSPRRETTRVLYPNKPIRTDRL